MYEIFGEISEGTPPRLPINGGWSPFQRRVEERALRFFFFLLANLVGIVATRTSSLMVFPLFCPSVSHDGLVPRWCMCWGWWVFPIPIRVWGWWSINPSILHRNTFRLRSLFAWRVVEVSPSPYSQSLGMFKGIIIRLNTLRTTAFFFLDRSVWGRSLFDLPLGFGWSVCVGNLDAPGMGSVAIGGKYTWSWLLVLFADGASTFWSVGTFDVSSMESSECG